MVPLFVQLVVNVCVFVPERGRERGYNAAISFWQNCLWGDASDPPTSGNHCSKQDLQRKQDISSRQYICAPSVSLTQIKEI